MSKETLEKAEATRDAMKETIQVAIDRNTRLSDLNVASTKMSENSTIFEKGTKEVKVAKRKEYFTTMATYICVIITVSLFGALFVWRLLLK